MQHENKNMITPNKTKNNPAQIKKRDDVSDIGYPQ